MISRGGAVMGHCSGGGGVLSGGGVVKGEVLSRG